MANYSFTPALFSPRAAAAYLGISESTLRKLDLPRLKIGARVLLRKADLDAFADSVPYEGETAEEANSCDDILRAAGL